MSALSKVQDFLSKHRRKFIVGGFIITGSVLLTKYAQKRLKEWQDKETVEFFERNRKLSHFESIGKTCNQTILNLSSALLDVVFKNVNTDEIIENLKNNPEKKVDMWNSLKISVFSKAGVIIYSVVMLVVTLKIQMSIIGGYLYKDPNSVSTDLQQKYLLLCQNLLDSGVKKLSYLMESEVKKSVENIDLKQQLKLSDIEAIYWSIQTSLATHKDSPVEQIRNYIFSDNMSESSDVYNNMLRDTADFLDSDEVKSLTTHCINRGFIQLGDRIAEFYNQNELENSSAISKTESFKNPFELKKPLAKLLPIINRLLSKQSLPQSLVQQLVSNEKLHILSANIYESLL